MVCLLLKYLLSVIKKNKSSSNLFVFEEQIENEQIAVDLKFKLVEN